MASNTHEPRTGPEPEQPPWTGAAQTPPSEPQPAPVGPPPGDPGTDPTRPLPAQPEPTRPLPVEPVLVEPTQPLPPLATPPSGPQPVNPAMASYASGPPQPGYPGTDYGQGYADQGYGGGQPYPGQPYAGPAGQPGPYAGPPQGGQAYSGPAPAGYAGPASGPYPTQPYAGQPYTGQAYPGQPYAAEPYPAQPGSGQAPYGGPPRRSSKAPVIIASIVGILVIGLVGVFALNGLGRPTAPGPTASTGTTATVPPPQPADAPAAVQGYLEALSRGEADAALAYAAAPPDDTAFLTSDVLAASLRLAPISDIRVEQGSVTGGSVDASYKVGSRVVDTSFAVVRNGTDWRLADVASSVDLSGVSTDLLTLSLNGVPLTGDAPTLFPGAYVLAANDSRYTVSKGAFLVESPADSPDTSSMRLKLSAKGVSAVRAAAQKKLTSCLRSRSLAPQRCGFGTYLPGGNKPRNSSIRWRVTKNAGAMKKIKPVADAGNPTVVRANVNVQVRVDLSSTNGRRWFGYSAIYQVQADLSGSKVAITFGG